MTDHAAKLELASLLRRYWCCLSPASIDTIKTIQQTQWVDEGLRVLGELFGGTTAFPKGRGVWRDDAQGGKLIYDKPVVIQCYTSERLIARAATPLRDFLERMGTETRQGAVGLVIDRDYLEIGFPLDSTKE